MKTIEPTHDFLDAFVRWASTREDMQAIALVGSYAEARPGLILISTWYCSQTSLKYILKILDG